MAISSMALWDLRMSNFWMDAEMDYCEDRANNVLVMEPLMKVETEEWLAPTPTFVAREDCTNGKK